jgi:hypothetical protein
MDSIERYSRKPFAVVAALSLITAHGCSESIDGVASPKAEVVTAMPAIAQASEVVAVTTASAPPTPVDGDESLIASATEDREEAKPAVAEYQAPFPDRVDLFVPPKRQGGVRVEGDAGDSVDLLGFIRLDRQQAVLSINGQVTRIAEGASQDGVEVISIHPPNVVLQRGRQRWQDSLDN